MRLYDETFSITNAFTAPEDDQELAGWALSSQGPVAYPNGAQIWKLTAEAGKTVTLYAVWREKLSNTYITQLDQAFAAYGADHYTIQDWTQLTELRSQAAQEIVAAWDAATMQVLLDNAKSGMAAVPTLEDRAQQVSAQWHLEHPDAFSGQVTEENADALYATVQQATTALTVELVSSSTGLQNTADQELVLAQVLTLAANDLHTLNGLADAALWAQKLGGLSSRFMESVTSQQVSDYAAACEAATAHQAYLSTQLTNALTARWDLAQSKQQAAAQLRLDFGNYNLERYSEANRLQLETLFRNGLNDLEAAASTASVSTLLSAVQSAIAAVPTQDQEQQPGGGDGGNTGDGGSSGGSTGGGGASGGSSGGGGASGGSSGGGGASGGSSGGGEKIQPPEETPTPDQQPDSEEQPPQSNIVYSDVCETDWYYADVQYVSSHHMMQGYADGRFDPEGRLTRSQLAQILYNLEGRPAVNGTDRFYDTDPNAWYGPAMAWAVESGILTGYGNGNIGPNDPVTREQLAVMLLRYAQLNDLEVDGRADLSGYADSSAISGYALEAMAWANAAGIVQGSGGKLLPGSTTSRAQTAAMLTRFSRQLPTA